MFKKYLSAFVVILCATLSSFSQNTFIPDNNFENYLETHNASGNIVSLGDITSMGNGIAFDYLVFTNRINTITFLNLNSQNIGDLTGIEDFTSLLVLDCSNNLLASLDISQNTGLTFLACQENQLTNLDVSALAGLSTLNCQTNQLTSLDVSTNANLVFLNCFNNQLQSLDVSVNAALTTLTCFNNQLTYVDIANGNNTNITIFDSQANASLSCIKVDDIAYSYANWTNIDPATTFNTDCGITTIPDDNFELYLETHDASGAVVPLGDPTSMGNGIANDNYVITANINTVTTLNIDNQNIANLTGIEDFTGLTTLICWGNQLTSLDVSNNTALNYLNCGDNLLPSLDVSANIGLAILYCYNNQLTSLDVSKNTALTDFSCRHNQITSLDVSANTSLTVLSCRSNQLTNLDVSANTALNFLYCQNNQLTYLDVANGNNASFTDFQSQTNPNLTCITVDNVAYSSANWTNIDPASSFSEDCGITIVPDDIFENYLETHDASGAVVILGDPTSMGNGIANDNYVITASINTVTNLNIDSLGISNLKGIEDFIALEFLGCSSNFLSSLDVSANTALVQLFCVNNQLTSLDLSQNLGLVYLVCYSNQLTSLDVSQNTALEFLQCNNNQLTNLDVSLNTALTDLYCNSNLLTSLDVSQNTALNYFYCYSNQLTSLDVSQNTALTNFQCNSNQLTSLDLSNNTALSVLICNNNELTSLDLSENTALNNFSCQNNQLEFLDVSNGNNTNFTFFNSENNPSLICIKVDDVVFSNLNWTAIDPASAFSLDCGTYVPDDNFELYLESHDANGNVVTIGAANSMGNGITNDNFVPTNKINTVTGLDINSQNIAALTGIEDFTALESLICSNNQLTSIDVSSNTGLIHLNCLLNQLTSLDVSQNTELTQLICVANQISSLDVSASQDLSLLFCQYNQLSFLNVANGNNTNIMEIDSSNNPNLFCINVDDVNYSNTNWTTANFIFDPQSYFSTDCSFNDTPDRAYTLTVGHDFADLAQIADNTNATSSELLDPTIPLPTGCGGGFDSAEYNGDDLWYAVTIPDDGSVIIETEIDDSSITDTGLALYSGTPGSLVQIACNDDINVGGGDYFSQMILTGQTPNAIVYVRVWSWQNNETGTFQISAYRNPAVSTYVPDDNFENYLETHDFDGNTVALGSVNSMGNGIANDNYIFTDRINTVIELDVANLDITDLSGIEGFTALETLFCYNNTITILNLSQNTVLTGLFCGGNNITSLNVSQNTELLQLLCQNNNLTSLNVSANVALTYLNCINNDLTSLDVSTNTGLTGLFCNSNNLISFDVSANTALIDLSISENEITSFDVSTNTLLAYLDARDNNLTSLDFSINNTALGYLNFGTNAITTIDLSSLTGLTRIDCYQNPLTSLDVSNLSSLDVLWAEQMPFLSSLNIANGNNNNLVSILIDNSPNLTCVTVDNQTIADDWNSGINIPIDDFVLDPQTAFSTNCNEVVIEAKAYLQGAFLNPRIGETSFMRDDLRALGHLPLVSPYDGTPLTNGTEFNVIGADAIVDWVQVQLRDDVDPSIVIEEQSALLQRDGDIVAPDGVSPLVFIQQAKHYNVVVKHRNHSGIITSLKQPFPLNQAQNYFDGSTGILGTNALVNMNGTFAMWTGDVNGNGKINFSGADNDTNSIKDGVLADPANGFNSVTFTSSGYLDYDLDLNGEGKFSGANNEGNVIKDNILAHPGNGFNSPTFTINSAVPEN